jgi:hypothetical protein
MRQRALEPQVPAVRSCATAAWRDPEGQSPPPGRDHDRRPRDGRLRASCCLHGRILDLRHVPSSSRVALVHRAVTRTGRRGLRHGSGRDRAALQHAPFGGFLPLVVLHASPPAFLCCMRRTPLPRTGIGRAGLFDFRSRRAGIGTREAAGNSHPDGGRPARWTVIITALGDGRRRPAGLCGRWTRTAAPPCCRAWLASRQPRWSRPPQGERAMPSRRDRSYLRPGSLRWPFCGPTVT